MIGCFVKCQCCWVFCVFSGSGRLWGWSREVRLRTGSGYLCGGLADELDLGSKTEEYRMTSRSPASAPRRPFTELEKIGQEACVL